ncbi:Integrase catalytic domain-containing protein [Mycena sanguinolenta]|uniref:Integrase catalytic domain-containing protein n=1 Tax=Mycena sanguinolenta TaxID=230812 RepID=A0A8H7D6R0_9AGAR|nr:Integrase catalytic domain-containing protein [Mycena sanguinolenta]
MNGKVERYHLTIHSKARAMRIGCSAPPFLWDEFCVTAAYLHARAPSSAQDGRTPFECFENIKPNLSHLREIGCRAFVLIESNNPKVYDRSLECVLIGYTPRSKAYRCWERLTGKVYDSINVRFIESGQTERVHWDKSRLAERATLTTPAPSAAGVPDDQSSDDPVLTTSPPPDPADGSRTVPPPATSPPLPPPPPVPSPPPATCTSAPPTPPPPPPPLLRRSTRPRTLARHRNALAVGEIHEDQGELEILQEIEQTIADTPEDDDGEEIAMLVQLNAYLTENPVDVGFPDDPRNYAEAMAAPDADKWMEGTREELDTLQRMGVYKLVAPNEVPSNKTVLGLKPVYVRKRDMDGNVVRHKVRYCVKGYHQVYGRDYTTTTSPTARLESFCAVLHLAASRGWDIHQVDVKTAFLNADLPPDEIQYTRQLKHFEEKGKENWLWMVMKSLYGLHQAGRAWNKHMHAAMLGWGFCHLLCEWCVYIRCGLDGQIIIVVVHVDNMLCAANRLAEIDTFKRQLCSRWAISDLGEVRYCLGISIVHDPERRTIALSQTALIDRIVSLFNQTDAYPVSTPMETKLPLRRPTDTPSQELTELLAAIPYRSLIGCLMYLAIGTRPDIAFPVNKLTCFLDCFRVEHWMAAIRVVRYLKGTRDFALVLGGDAPTVLTGHSDSDFANDLDCRKSIMGYSFTLGSGVEAEYIAASEASKEACWLRMLLRGIDITVDGPTPVLCDNEAAIVLAGDQSFHSRAKHIDNRYHHIRDCVEKKVVLPRVSSHDNVADTLTKALPFADFVRHRTSLGVVSGGVLA